MRRVLLLCLLFSANSYGQTTFTTKYLSYLFKTPISSNAYPSGTNIYDTIYTDNKLIGIKLLDTTIRNKGERFLVAAYKNHVGYVWFEHLDLKDEDFQKLKALNTDPATALSAAQKGWIADSIMNEQKKELAIKERIEKQRTDSLNKIALLQNIVKRGLAVVEMNFEESQYSTVNFTPSIINYSKKTIKYATFHLVFFNPVWDPIGNKVVKMVGPIQFQAPGTTTFEDVIYTKQFGRGRVEKLVVEYMDGTFRTYTTNELYQLSIEGRL
jgi:hypothetical protein